MSSVQRPLRITIISIFSIIGNCFVIFLGFLGIISPFLDWSPLGLIAPLLIGFSTIIGLIMVSLVILSLVMVSSIQLFYLTFIPLGIFGALIYFNLLKSKRWAWILTLILNGISVISLIVFLNLFLLNIFYLIICLLYSIFVIISLSTPAASVYFKEKPKELLSSLVPQLPAPPQPTPPSITYFPIKPRESRRRELEKELEKTINYLNRLEQEKDKISEKAYEKLKEEYLAKVEKLKEEINKS